MCNPEGKYISYGELISKTMAAANLVLSVTPRGSRVAVMNSNTYFDALGVLGVLAAECSVVPISLNYGEVNCCNIIDRVEPDVVLTDYEELPDTITAIIRKKNIKVLPFTDSETFTAEVEKKCINNDIALIMSTSGTTGIPKGVILSHKNILSNIMDIAEYFKLTPEDHILIVRPLYHAAVMTGELLYALMSGCKITFYNEAFSPRRLLQIMDRVKCTAMCATPTLFYHLGIHKKNIALKELNKIVVSGECLLPQVADKIIEAFPDASFFNVYGLTEASPRVSYLEPEYFRAKIGSVGKPLKNVAIKIVDDIGRQLPDKGVGEIIVKGPNVMQGYWRDEEQTKRKLRDSWLFTGDSGYFDEEGFLYVLGRKDHMIIRAGMNIYPQEIENVLLQNEKIKEVMAWGEPDPKYGQKICIVYVPENINDIDETCIMEICRKMLQPYQWPDEIYISDKLTRNASGKIVRGRPSSIKELH